jgi:hypothetical protein
VLTTKPKGGEENEHDDQTSAGSLRLDSVNGAGKVCCLQPILFFER